MTTSDLILNLFKSFHNNNIIYCHWKSNEHLEASFKGDTDFDILFDSSQKTEVKEIFSQNGFVLFTPPFNRTYRDIEDFIAIDYEQNRMIHFHTHYSLEIGTSGLKEYRYAIEDVALSTRVFCPDFKCYLIDPRYEFVLLLIRLSLKVRTNWESGFQKNKEIILANVELNWLKADVSLELLLELIRDLEIPYTSEDVLKIYNEGFEFNTLYSISLQKNKIPNLIKENDFNIKAEKWSKWLYFQYGRVSRKFGFTYIIKRRVKEDGGFSIAVLGSDGSGKSTQMKELKRIFSTKIDIECFYLGSNKGSRSEARKFLEYLRKKDFITKIKIFDKILTVLFAFSIGFEKKARLRKAKSLTKKGVLVLFDRFPQTQTYGFNDGPLLRVDDKNRFLKWMGKFERKLYTPSLDKYPNIIFKLIADPEILSRRRAMTIEEINRKQNSIVELSFKNKALVVELNANKRIDEVTSSILKEIQNLWLASRDY